MSGYNPAGASANYVEAALLLPEDRSIRMELTSSYRDSRQWDNAASVFQKIIGDDPTYRPALYGLVEAYDLTGDQASCAEIFMSVETPANGEAFLNSFVWFQRSMIYLGRETELTRFLNELARRHPQSFTSGELQVGNQVDTNLPFVFIISLKRSGSVYVWRKISQGFNLPLAHLAFGNFFDSNLVAENYRQFVAGGMVSQERLVLSEDILDTLE